MRSEEEIMSLILDTARRDERVRVVGMEGSRTNPHAPRDAFQDYDVSYLVTDMDSFLHSDEWLDVFGPRIMMQKPEAMHLFPPALGGWFSYLMQFCDGSRIDLKLVPLTDLQRYLAHDKLLRILLDKDNLVPAMPPPTDEGYWVQRPGAEFYDDCCNEFWWVSTYVAKGLCRGEFLFAAEHLNSYVRPALLRMLGWQSGVTHGWQHSVGKAYKYLEGYLPKETWAELQSTFQNHSLAALWAALFKTCALFRRSSRFVGESLGYPYPAYDRNVSEYLEGLYKQCGKEPLR